MARSTSPRRHGRFGIRLEAPAQCRADVVQVGDQRHEPRIRAGCADGVVGGLGSGDEIAEVAAPQLRLLARFTEPLQPVLPQGLEEQVPGLARHAGLGHHHRTVAEVGQHVQDPGGARLIVQANRFYGGKRERSREHGQPPEQSAYLGAQPVVTLIDRGTQGALSSDDAPPGVDQQGEPVCKASLEVGQ